MELRSGSKFYGYQISNSVKIADSERIEILEAGFGDASRVIAHWGIGAKKLLGR
jgi:hypothetical protein